MNAETFYSCCVYKVVECSECKMEAETFFSLFCIRLLNVQSVRTMEAETPDPFVF